jgi:hypothetical protein
MTATDPVFGPFTTTNGDPPTGFQLHVTTARDLCNEPDDPGGGQLLGPLLLQGGRTIIVGDTGQGKTSLAFQMIQATLDAAPFLDWTGTGKGGRALIVDLEQGRRSVKRGLRDANLDDREDIDLVLVPDGLSLDSEPAELDELDRVIHAGGYTIVNLDPYYKAHRADEPNAERPIVDLMRKLDQLRARHGFSLILPAHPRKDIAGAATIRKLTIHDIAGSGAVTRGAEIVLAIERIAHGLARLRFLKDREGDLPIGEAFHLHYTKTDGFTRDPKDTAPARDYHADILAASTDGQWRTIRDYMADLKAGDKTLRPHLANLVTDHLLEYQEGPEGRTKNSKCWRLTTAALNDQMQLNAADAKPSPTQANLLTASAAPPRRGAALDAVGTPPAALNSVNRDAAWLEQIAATLDLDQTAGHLELLAEPNGHHPEPTPLDYLDQINTSHDEET